MSSIYAIVDKNTGKYLYVGSTTRSNPNIRKSEHFNQIKAQKHKIKQLNTYLVEDLDFEILCTLKTDCSLVINMMESFYNDLLHPFNKIIISGFRGSSVALARSNNKEFIKDMIDTCKKHY
ncbi:GIY-YIG nuclease family protein [Clostridium saccharoperbutylacetonicum]|uniref:GIY-YIG nuclease family protein n=1 Tax=Clostridium saccharoperbutylacetonicum TaxID=36745 RepID=UPI0039EB2A3C